ncbi:MAG: histidine kinase [Burkholderiaceae bacterium]|nr:histidine kinase [Burkholderiaceae bacterium]
MKRQAALAVLAMTTGPRAALQSALRSVLDAWRGITWRQVGATVVLGCALAVVLMGTGIAWFSGFTGLLLAVAAAQIRAFPLLLGFVVADRVAAGDPQRRAPYAWAVFVGAAAGMALAMPFVNLMGRALGFDDFTGAPPDFWFFAYQVCDMVLIAGAAVWVILDRRRAALARERMLGAELDRIAAERRSLQSDLQAMQARVEPQFLFNTLTQLGALYREDAARGERMLDELINYLRAAMPKMRDTSSTLGQEIELARAYLAIVAVRLGDRLTVSIDAPAEHGGARMPPMLLLPLVDHVVRAAAAPGPHSIAIRGAVEGALIRLTVSDSADAFTAGRDDAGIADLRERLAALFGPQARLTLGAREDGVSRAVLEMPLESAPADAP